MIPSLGVGDSNVGPLVPRDWPMDVDNVETIVDAINLKTKQIIMNNN